jgi:hypothetical protein
MAVRDAHQAVLDAEQRVTEAQAGLENARNGLDQALAAAGWKRMQGLLAGAHYERHPSGDVLPLAEVLSYELRSVA